MLIPSAEPVHYNPECQSLTGQSISIGKLMEDRLADDADHVIDGPLTDYEYSDSDIEDAGAVSPSLQKRSRSSSHSLDAMCPPTKEKKRDKDRSRQRRRKKDAMKQEREGTQVKDVGKRWCDKAAQNQILCGLDMRVNTSVTLPAWIGQSVANLPRQIFTKDRLLSTFRMTLFDWDGVYVPPLSLPDLC
jgi:hypothetical protein